MNNRENKWKKRIGGETKEKTHENNNENNMSNNDEQTWQKHEQTHGKRLKKHEN